LVLASQQSALARRDRAFNYKLNVTLIAGESSEVPSQLLHTSFGSHWPSPWSNTEFQQFWKLLKTELFASY